MVSPLEVLVTERKLAPSFGAIWRRCKFLVRLAYKYLIEDVDRFPARVASFADLTPNVRQKIQNRIESSTFCVDVANSGIVAYSPPAQIGGRLPVEGEKNLPYRMTHSHIAPVPAVKLYSLQDGVITGAEGFTYHAKSRRYIGETLPRWFKWDRDMELAYRSAFWTSTQQHVPGVTLSIARRAGENYYHFLHEALPCLLFLRKRLPAVEFDWIVVSGARCPFKLAWLNLIGIPEAKIIFTQYDSHLRFEQLLWVSDLSNHYAPNERIVDLLRDLLPEPVSGDGEESANILIASRARANIRQLDWENEICERYRGRLVDFAALTPAETMRVCREANIFIGAHGAAFANTVFCRADTKVYEICSDVDHVLYSRVSSICGLRHHIVNERQKSAFFSELDVEVKNPKVRHGL